MGNGKHGWHHAWHKFLNTLMQKHHKSYLSNLQTWKKSIFPPIQFFQDFDISYLSGSLQPLAAARSHSQYWQPLTCTRSPSQPLAATRSHSQPLEWPQVAASGRSKRVAASGRKWPPQTVPSEWPQVAANGRSQRVATSGRKWPLQPVPSEWPQVAASCRKWPLSAISISTLKATSLHFSFNPRGLFLATLVLDFGQSSCSFLANPRAPFWLLLVLVAKCKSFLSGYKFSKKDQKLSGYKLTYNLAITQKRQSIGSGEIAFPAIERALESFACGVGLTMASVGNAIILVSSKTSKVLHPRWSQAPPCRSKC